MYPAYFDETYVLWCFVQFQIDTHVPTKRSLRNHKMFQLWPVRMGQHIFWIFLDNFEGPLWNPSRANQLCSCRIHWFNPYHWLFCYIIHISPYPISMISSILMISTICEGYSTWKSLIAADIFQDSPGGRHPGWIYQRVYLFIRTWKSLWSASFV